jgi:hypothetical protein
MIVNRDIIAPKQLKISFLDFHIDKYLLAFSFLVASLSRINHSMLYVKLEEKEK